MANFTRKHYKTVAHVLRTNLKNHEIDLLGTANDDDTIDDIYATACARVAIKDIALDLPNVFRLDNPNYKPDVFFDACGIDDWEDINHVSDHGPIPFEEMVRLGILRGDVS